MNNDIQKIRRENLRRLADAHGMSTLGRRLGHTGPSFLSQMLSGKRPITEKTARKIESEMSLSRWALDTPPGARTPFAGTDRALIAQCVLAVEDELRAHGHEHGLGEARQARRRALRALGRGR